MDRIKASATLWCLAQMSSKLCGDIFTSSQSRMHTDVEWRKLADVREFRKASSPSMSPRPNSVTACECRLLSFTRPVMSTYSPPSARS